jgi:acyl-CoA thioesterase-2
MELGTLFDLAAHGPDTFVGAGPRYPWGGLYGGQIVAQALRAAASTVDESLAPHSLRAYFIRRGDNTEPVRYEVDRIRNGSSFSTRRVVARQAVGAILNLEASFQVSEEAVDVATIAMPVAMPLPDTLESSAWSDSFERCVVPPRLVDDHGRDGSGRVVMWMRVKRDVGDDPLLHRCWLAYLSDDLPTETVRRALALAGAPGWPSATPIDDDSAWEGIAYGASLDHTVWFHRPIRVDAWHLYDFSCHGYGGGRGLSIGHVFTADGAHAATVAQEVLLRRARTSG